LFVDKSHELFSSEPQIILGDPPDGLSVEMFIAMDPPKHDVQRERCRASLLRKTLKKWKG
jgi:hypothetical protein